MHYSSYIDNHSKVTAARYAPDNRNGEMHAIITLTERMMTYSEQLDSLVGALKRLMANVAEEGYSPVVVRLLLSDAANQAQRAISEVKSIAGKCAVAYVQQPPLDGTKIAAVVYMMQDVKVEKDDEYTSRVERGGKTHLWSANVCKAMGDTLAETHSQLEYLERMLASRGLNIADNCVRTWFYVQNIDVNYGAVVRARKDNFDRNGLTVDTHYISSTGIGGRHAQKEVTSIMDAYSVGGLEKGQMGYLYASANMNRTSDYGVTFERGTYVDYADRRQVYVSGTASIDNRGAVVAGGDIVAQTHRMIENVGALLAEAESSVDDVAHIVVYLRDVADYSVVRSIFEERFPRIPYVITLAPVCRPGWLIEMECMSVASRNSSFGMF